MSDSESKRPRCYGEYTEARTSCFTCDEQILCAKAANIAYIAGIAAKNDKKEKGVVNDAAVKLDSGKRKLSLIFPTMLQYLIKTDNPKLSPISDAMENLSLAAHAEDEDNIYACLEEAIADISRYLAGGKIEAIEQLAVAMEYGEAKPEYGRNNWKKGMEWSRYLDAAMRHGLKILAGEAVDPDSGNRHVAHMLGSIHMLMGNMALCVGKNDIFLED